MFISTITQAMDTARRKFTRGEQLMLIDIFNSTMLTPGILGQHLTAQIEDSFALYPGQYEEKWEVNQKEMMEKIVSLTPADAIFLELWAVGYWAVADPISTGETLENYVQGKFNLESRLREVIEKLEMVGEKLEQTKSAFKSATIAEARKSIEEVSSILSNLL
jgi:hypothetical protein